MPMPALEQGVFRVSVEYMPEDGSNAILMEADLKDDAVEYILSTMDEENEYCDALAPLIGAILQRMHQRQIVSDMEVVDGTLEIPDNFNASDWM